MTKLSFRSSSIASLGVELEIQIVNPITFDMKSSAKTLMRVIQESKYQAYIKPEITQSMIEVNSSVHLSPHTLLEEFTDIRNFLIKQARDLGMFLCGGGTHPFQKWVLGKIFPTKRFKNLSRIYQYLSKQSTVFGLHVHVGCPSGEEALYLTHVLAKYVPHFIALSASSPFYQGVDTGYHSSRMNVFSVYPTSGIMPYLTNWQIFSDYFHKMKQLQVITSMKDFYWDIRPKPEFGTVEIRVCDMPLTIEKAVIVAAYIQSLALYLLQEHPYKPSLEWNYLYNFNRFQAGRYGFDGDFIDPITLQHIPIGDDLLNTLNIIEKYAAQLNNLPYLEKISAAVKSKSNDATRLREIKKEVGLLQEVVHKQCQIWADET